MENGKELKASGLSNQEQNSEAIKVILQKQKEAETKAKQPPARQKPNKKK